MQTLGCYHHRPLLHHKPCRKLPAREENNSPLVPASCAHSVIYDNLIRSSSIAESLRNGTEIGKHKEVVEG
jgi:hypothetical protein